MFFFLLDSKQNINGSVIRSKIRPRIPTPDVTKDILNNERERLSISAQGAPHSNLAPTNIGIMSQQHLTTTTSLYPINSSDVPVVGTLLLSPIKEMESTSVNNTLTANHPTTNALAKSVMPASLKSAGNPSFANNKIGDKQPILMFPTTTKAIEENSSVFVIPTSPALNSTQVSQINDEPVPITTIFSTPKSKLSEDMTTTVVTTFPVHKSSSFSDVTKLLNRDHKDTSSHEEKISIESPEVLHHSLSEPASKTSTLTKHEVYV